LWTETQEACATTAGAKRLDLIVWIRVVPGGYGPELDHSQTVTVNAGRVLHNYSSFKQKNPQKGVESFLRAGG